MDEKWSEIADKVRGLTNRKKILLLIAGGCCYSDEIYEILRGLEGVEITYAVTENGACIHDESILSKLGRCLNMGDDVYSCVRGADLILIPFMTRNTLTKSALGIADNLVTTAISEALMMQKMVIAVDSCWDPMTEQSRLRKLNRNAAYTNMLNGYRGRLEEFGVVFSPIYEFEECVQSYIMGSVLSSGAQVGNAVITDFSEDSGQMEIITCEDLARMESVAIPRNAKLTDLAKEYVAEHRIKVVDAE